MLRKVFLLVYLLVMGFSAAAQVDSLLIQEGTASYYGRKFHGRKTASGEIFHLDSMTAAHKSLPLGTWVRIKKMGSEKSVIVKINDRLPYSSKHVIDVSLAAAEELSLIQSGFGKVRIEAMDLDQLEKLVEYYEDREHPGLRIRPYYQTIVIPKRELDFNLVRYEPN